MDREEFATDMENIKASDRMHYEGTCIRPPPEADSILLQVTLGCSWNKCAFCEMYTEKKFVPRKEENIVRDIDKIASVSGIGKVFFADGNPTVLSTEKLLKLLKAINEKFPRITRISSYALPRDLISKSSEELRLLRENGLKLIYVGIDS